MSEEKAIIIGAGPAGLTAGFELLERSEVVPVLVEKSEYIGGLARTMVYKGNRIDIGPHRFFSRRGDLPCSWNSRGPESRALDRLQ